MFSPHLQEKTRRDVLKLAAAGVFAPTLSGWLPLLAKAAPEGGKGKAKSCIVLFMDGGPSHKDTFDLKPESKGAGEFKPIKTAADGIEISEHLPNIAKVMNHGVLVRSMTTPEGAHARAKYYMHTGFREGQGGVIYPSIGSLASQEVGNPDSAMPNYVTIGGRSYGSGFLGPKHQPLLITDPNRGVEDLKTAVSNSQFETAVLRSSTPRLGSKTSRPPFPTRSSTTASGCSTRWRRRSTASTARTPSPTTRPPTSGRSS